MKNRQNKRQMNQVRLIGGDWRGRKVSFPSVEGLRPTGDRIRETLFNWLAFDIAGTQVLDLFAGSGALGLEALSRGAKSATFVEPNKLAASAVRDSLQMLRGSGQVIEEKAQAYIDCAPKQSFDLIFIDPPFGDNLHQNIVDQIDQSKILSPEALIYVEAPASAELTFPKRWTQLKHKQTGGLCYWLHQFDCDQVSC